MKLIQGDCLEVMPTLPAESVNLILCDLPYGITGCKWDAVIPFERLWQAYDRLLKPSGVIALTASQPFTSALVMSNPRKFKVEWIWKKNAGSNFATVKWQPMKEHESVLIFGSGTVPYFPQMQERATGSKAGKRTYKTKPQAYAGIKGKDVQAIVPELRCPSSVQNFNRERGLHPTQKPVALMEYMIKTYTNEGGTVLDNCMGSGTTGVACQNLGRDFIGIEKDPAYFEIARKRMGL